MKKIILLIASILFSTLFYQKHFGLNIFLFSLITTGILVFFYPKKRKQKQIIIIASIYIITAFQVFLYHNTLSIITNLISFFLFVGSISEKKASIYIKFFNGFYSTIVSTFALYFERVENEIEQVKKQEINYMHWLKIIGIPIIIITIFIALYRNANPVFDSIISKIDFSFINVQWLLFTGLGYYLLNNITNPLTINPTTNKDLNTSDNLNKKRLKEVSEEKLKSENQLGLILMVLLNILLVFLLITDTLFLTQTASESKISAVELSIQVHKGINSLIISIIFAIILIIYFFRGNLNFYKKNKALITATFIWIILNSILVIVTVFKNYQYVYTFGLTYKRIGVFIYLFLSFLGLVYTFIKVKNIKNIVFLFRKNIEIAFAILVITSFINWDDFIAKYNLSKVEKRHLDVTYLLKLPNTANTLKQYKDNNTNYQVEKFSTEIEKKYQKHQMGLTNNSWQEIVFENLNNQ